MISTWLDSLLAGHAAAGRANLFTDRMSGHVVTTATGQVRLFDSGSDKPCVILVPDGPNVIEHYARLVALLEGSFRVVCFDMPGFGHSLPAASYAHSLHQGAAAVLAVMDALNIATATLAFSCANGFYALHAAQLAPQRVTRLLLSQTPSLAAMRAWSNRVVPKPLHVPVLGQAVGWLARRRAARGWYRIALPKGTDTGPFERPALHALACGACFCLAGVVQGLAREDDGALRGVSVPCTMLWGPQDRSHRLTDPQSFLELVPHAEIIRLEACGHFPDIEAPERFAQLLSERALAQA